MARTSEATSPRVAIPGITPPGGRGISAPFLGIGTPSRQNWRVASNEAVGVLGRAVACASQRERSGHAHGRALEISW
jgi:hypothetical protein